MRIVYVYQFLYAHRRRPRVVCRKVYVVRLQGSGDIQLARRIETGKPPRRGGILRRANHREIRDIKFPVQQHQQDLVAKPDRQYARWYRQRLSPSRTRALHGRRAGGLHYCDAQLRCARFYTKWIQDILGAQNPETGYVPNGAPWQPGCGGGVAWGAAM